MPRPSVRLIPSRPVVQGCCLLACLGGLALAQPAQAEKPPATEPAPLLVHDGKLIQLPELSPYRARVKVAEVRAEAAPHRVTVPGTIEADPTRMVNVLPALTGRLVELRVHLGERVKVGQVLARLQSSDLLQAGSDAAKAQDAYNLAVKARDRARDVNAAGGNAQKDLEAAESAVVQARAELERARTRLKVLGATGDEGNLAQVSLPVLAPLAGVITALNVGMGAVINDPTAALMTITNLDQVYVTAQVPERLLPQVRVGQLITAVTTAYPDRPLHGTVDSISSMLDPDTRRTRVRARFSNPGSWLHTNMFVSVEFAVAQPAQPVVPASALVLVNDRVLVFVERKPWTFEAREVQIGLEQGDRVRIRAGLQAGERVVVSGGVLLND